MLLVNRRNWRILLTDVIVWCKYSLYIYAPVKHELECVIISATIHGDTVITIRNFGDSFREMFKITDS